MILGIISFVFGLLGIYGFFINNLFLLFLGMGITILEHAIGIFAGGQKGLTTIWLSLLCSFGMAIGGYNWIQAIAICLCFENVICFILGGLLLIVVGKKMYKQENIDIK